MRPSNRGRPLPPPATPTAVTSNYFGGRDSDVSSLHSSAGLNPKPPSDRSQALRTINAYLASHSVPVTLKPPMPSAKDVTTTSKFLLSCLGFPQSQLQKVDDDLNTVLKSLNCPIKYNKSQLRVPGTPHSWPVLLSVLHWLVQICMYNDHLSSNSTEIRPDESIFGYVLESYLHYIKGDDDAVDELDAKFMKELEKERDGEAESLREFEGTVRELEEKLESMKSGPSQKEVLEKEKGLLEEDVKKFNAMIEQLQVHMGTVQKAVVEKDQELEAKVLEKERICEENRELKKKVEEQGINARDAERLKRELQVVEKDIAATEAARNDCEEKVWELDSVTGHRVKELEELMIECNQAIKRLKLVNGLCYQLNVNGSSPSEVLGIDYKSTLKPALASLTEDIEKTRMGKLEEMISFQQQSVENNSKIEARRKLEDDVQAHINEVESQVSFLRKEIQEYTSRCATEARNIVHEVEAEARNLDIVEKEAEELMKASNANLQDTITKTEHEVQMCAHELLALVDSVSKYKEHMSSKIAEMKTDLMETAGEIVHMHKFLPSDASH